MRYDEIRSHVRDHFRELLGKFKENVTKGGPKDATWEAAIRNRIMLRDEPVEDWADQSHPEGLSGVVRDFCEARGIEDRLSDKERLLVAGEYQKGSSEYFAGMLKVNESFRTMDISDTPPPSVPPTEEGTPQAESVPATSFEDVIDKYFAELTLSGGLGHTDAPDNHVKAIVGHTQAGVTFTTYFKAGYQPSQLKAAIDKFDF